MSLLSGRFTSRLSMVDIADKYGIERNTAGFAHCPFHKDNTASLKIYENKGDGYYCFGCNSGGSIIDFIMKYFNVTYTDSLKRIDSDFNLHILDTPYDATVNRIHNYRNGLLKHNKKIKEVSVQSMIKLFCKYWQSIKYDEPMSDSFCESLSKITDLEYRIDGKELT
jgi:DNA primase